MLSGLRSDHRETPQVVNRSCLPKSGVQPRGQSFEPRVFPLGAASSASLALSRCLLFLLLLLLLLATFRHFEECQYT